MCVKFIIAVEPLSTEAAFRMAFEAALIDGSGVVVAKFLVLRQFGRSKQLMLMCEDLLIPCTKIAHLLIVSGLDMAMQVGPS
jgi:hypothetical protein